MKQTQITKTNEIRIGGVCLPHPFFMAPLAGFTDEAFRIIAGEHGAALTYTEMVSAKGIVYGDNGSGELLHVDALEKAPCAVQLFGHEEYYMRRAVQMLPKGEDGTPLHAMIDINMGCPVQKVVRNGEGSALMNDRFTAAAVVRATLAAEKEEAERDGREPRPVTVKCRIGWDETSRESVLDFAPAMEEAGASAICVHGRTREQFYSGKSDWELVSRVHERLSVPLIGSGDLFTAEDGLMHIQNGDCDAVMYARGGLGNPWIFRKSISLLNDEDGIATNPEPFPTEEERNQVMRRHLDLAIERKGEKRAVREMRKLWSFYMKGIPGAAEIRRRINSMETRAELLKLLAEIASK